MTYARLSSLNITKAVRGCAVGILLLAMTVQALLPTGFMFGPSTRDGTFAVTLCTSQGISVAYVNSDGQIVGLANDHGDDRKSPQPDTDHSNGLCAFAGNNGAALAASVQQSQIPTTWLPASQPLSTVTYVAPGLGLAAPPPPKTGPPIQA